MGAHHAPAHVARHTRPAHASSSTDNLRLGRLAGRGVLTASAALAMTGAGAGAALAHDGQAAGGLLADNDTSLLCGILGGDRCSSDSESSSESSSETTDDTPSSVFDRFDEGTDSTSTDSTGSGSQRSAERSSSDADGSAETAATRPSSTGADAARSQQSAPQQQASQLDAPPPPGEVRSINLPN